MLTKCQSKQTSGVLHCGPIKAVNVQEKIVTILHCNYLRAIIIIILADLPVFCILQVFVKVVSGGTDSPSPIVTSFTKDMQGALMLGLSKS